MFCFLFSQLSFIALISTFTLYQMYMCSSFSYTTWHTFLIFSTISNFKIICLSIFFYNNFCILIHTCIYSIIFVSMLCIEMRSIMTCFFLTIHSTFWALIWTSMRLIFHTIMCSFVFFLKSWYCYFTNIFFACLLCVIICQCFLILISFVFNN